MPVNYSKLKSWLEMADLKKTNFPLYQLLNELITNLNREQGEVTTTIIDNTSSVTDIKNSDLLTFSDETALLPNSRELLPGDNISFDDSVPNERTINVFGISELGYWTLLTDGDPIEAELVFSDDGDVISEFVPI